MSQRTPPELLVNAYIASEARVCQTVALKTAEQPHSLPGVARAIGSACWYLADRRKNTHASMREESIASGRLKAAQKISSSHGDVIVATRLALCKESLDLIKMRSDAQAIAQWRAKLSITARGLQASVLAAASIEKREQQYHRLKDMASTLGLITVIHEMQSTNTLAIPALPYFETGQSQGHHDLIVVHDFGEQNIEAYPMRIAAEVPKPTTAELYLDGELTEPVTSLPEFRQLDAVDHGSIVELPQYRLTYGPGMQETFGSLAA